VGLRAFAAEEEATEGCGDLQDSSVCSVLSYLLRCRPAAQSFAAMLGAALAARVR